MADTRAPTPSPLMAKLIVVVHKFLYQVSRGRIGATMGGAPVLLLTVAGRKSGKLYTLPLIYVKTAAGYAVVASRGGAPQHPAWYLNLAAASSAIIQIGSKKTQVSIKILMPADAHYQSIWKDALAVFPGYADYKKNTSREFPIVALLPQA